MTGRLVRAVGLTFEVEGIEAAIGDMVRLGRDLEVIGQIVTLGDRGRIGMPLGEFHGLRIGDPVMLDRDLPGIPVGRELLGRVIDAMGRPLDTGPSRSTGWPA